MPTGNASFTLFRALSLTHCENDNRCNPTDAHEHERNSKFSDSTNQSARRSIRFLEHHRVCVSETLPYFLQCSFLLFSSSFFTIHLPSSAPSSSSFVYTTCSVSSLPSRPSSAAPFSLPQVKQTKKTHPTRVCDQLGKRRKLLRSSSR